jgi:uncharacterized membrane protein HdeD (DUF308 family)
MGIGASIFLIALGAILAFALNASVGFIDLQLVGWIFMVVGLLGLVASLVVLNRRRTVVVEDPAGRTRVERDPYDPM